MKNLLGRLMSRPFDELKVIAPSWGTLTRDPNPTQNDLAIAVYHTMVDPSAVRAVWESIDPETRSFIVWLLNQRNMLALVDDLPGHLDRPPEEVEPLLYRTRSLGLVDVDEVLVRGTRVVSSGDNLYSWAAKNQPEAIRRKVVSISTESAKVIRDILDEEKRPPPFDEPFAELLGRLEQDVVQRIALAWKLPDAGRYYKSELIGVMSEFLAAGAGREGLLQSLSPASQAVFAYLESQQGRAPASQVRSHFEWDERELRYALLPLTQRALVWDVLSTERRHLFIPFDLLKGDTEGTLKIARLMQPKLEVPAPHNSEKRLPYELGWDLLTLLAAASQQELSLTLQDGRVTKRIAKRINDAFLHPVDLKGGSEYIDMVVHMAQLLGLLAERLGEQPALAVTSRVDEWVKLPLEAERRRLFGLWQEDRKWTEPAAYGTIYWWNSDLTGARKRLVKHLLDIPTDAWIGVEPFLRKIHLTEPFIIWSQDELVRRFGLRALQGFRSQWFEIEGRIIADMLKTMLFWLGAVEVGRDKQRRFVAFKVTQEGRHLLDQERAPEATGTPSKSLLVQPNFEVLVLHPESHVLWNVLRMADLVRHDRVSVYVLNKESVVRGVESGMSAASMTEFLQENTGKGLPQNVAHSIADWSRLIKRASIRRTTLIEVDDPAVLDELMSSRKTKRYLLQRLSPTIAVALLPEVGDGARDDPWQKLMKELRAAGYFPRFTDEEIQPVSAASDTKVVRAAQRRATPTIAARGRKANERAAEIADNVPQDRTGTDK